ncbi:MAG TPA: hypothetical protein VLX92_01435 [Kofleriaceae bacterium]|nr:hypothetical protein [Kofleriaceae bacterium]
MRFPLVLCAALAACGHHTVDDCAVVHDHPDQAAGELSRRYPGDPIKVATVIENCVAPTGEPCDRIAKIARAIPQMMETPIKLPDKLEQLCRAAPPQVQRCLLPSYVLAHRDDCRKLLTGPLAIDLPMPHRAGDPEACKDHHLLLDIELDKAGVWLATSTSAWCFAAMTPDGYDYEWLEHQVREAQGDPDCVYMVEVAADPGVSYQDIIHAMDTAIRAGRPDIGLTDPSGLENQTPRDRKTAAATCAKPEPVANGSAGSAVWNAGSGSIDSLPASGSQALAKVPVVVITKTELEVRGEGLAPKTIPIATLPPGSTIAALASALPVKPASNMIILQADKDTDAGLISRTVSTLKQAGYDNVLFAVRDKNQ